MIRLGELMFVTFLKSVFFAATNHAFSQHVPQTLVHFLGSSAFYVDSVEPSQ
jgi:hypothetical protein